MTFEKWYNARLDKELIDKKSAMFAFNWAQDKGIRIHDGQKILVKYILDNDKGINENARQILELFLGDRK